MNHPIFFQRLEAAAFLLAIVIQYFFLGGSVWFFALLFFLPDVFIFGYLLGNKVGAVSYNIGHSITLPILFTTYGLVTGTLAVQLVGLIWLGHIGFDRALGFGLKEATSFRHTHLGMINFPKK